MRTRGHDSTSRTEFLLKSDGKSRIVQNGDLINDNDEIQDRHGRHFTSIPAELRNGTDERTTINTTRQHKATMDRKNDDIRGTQQGICLF